MGGRKSRTKKKLIQDIAEAAVSKDDEWELVKMAATSLNDSHVAHTQGQSSGGGAELQIIVKTVTEKTVTVDVEANEQIDNVKVMIQEKADIPKE